MPPETDTETKRQLRRIRRRASATRDAIETATDEHEELLNMVEEYENELGDGEGESDSEADQLASSVMTLEDVETAHREQLSPAEYLNERHGVDASAAADESDLREQLADARGANSGGVS